MSVDIKVCRICGQPNGCDVANRDDCWCFKNKVPLELLELLPDSMRGKSCVCLKCIKAFQTHPEGFVKSYLQR